MLILVGGFLGAGKTSLQEDAAKRLTNVYVRGGRIRHTDMSAARK